MNRTSLLALFGQITLSDLKEIPGKRMAQLFFKDGIAGIATLRWHQYFRNQNMEVVGAYVLDYVCGSSIISTGLLLLHQPRKTSRNLVSTTIQNFRYEGRRSIALVLLLTKLWGVGFAADAAFRVSDSYNSDLITSP